MNSNKHLHLTLNDRIEIQTCLEKGMSFKAIGKRISKDQTTVSKEVKRNSFIKLTTVIKKDKEEHLFTENCPLLVKAPFVCNPCRRFRCQCTFNKFVYYAKTAQDTYEKKLSQSREGIPLNKESFYEMDKILSDGIAKGQHIYHITKTHNFKASNATIYNHINKGYFSFCKIDLPRAVKFKPRKSKNELDYVPKGLKIGRSYNDFLNYIQENDISSWVEMDTVIGEIGGKAILTLHFTQFNFMLGFLLDEKTSLAVSQVIQSLKAKLRANNISFSSLFPIVLTDNGGEFANVFAVEDDTNGNPESKVFFCDPYKSCQKGKIEKNHTLFRDIVPSGSSFNNFDQEMLNTFFSHVNCVKRAKFNGKSPYDLFLFTYGDDILSIFNIEQIPADEVIQSPKLLKQLLRNK